MRAFPLTSLVLLAAVGEAFPFQTPAWTNGLAPRFEEASNMLTGLVARDPKGGGKGGGGGSHGSGDDDDENSSNICTPVWALGAAGIVVALAA